MNPRRTLPPGRGEVVHFTWDEITRVPGQVVAALRRAFERGDAARDMSSQFGRPSR